MYTSLGEGLHSCTASKLPGPPSSAISRMYSLPWLQGYVKPANVPMVLVAL